MAGDLLAVSRDNDDIPRQRSANGLSHNLLFTPIFHSVADSLSAPRAIYESQRAVMAIDITSLSVRFYAVVWVCQYLCACEIVAIPHQYVCKKLLKSDNV